MVASNSGPFDIDIQRFKRNDMIEESYHSVFIILTVTTALFPIADMANIAKLLICLASLVALMTSPVYCAPQLWNFGWPAQQEPRFPANKAFVTAEAGQNKPLSFLPSTFSPSLPQRNVPMVMQPQKLQRQDIVPESRLGQITRVSKPQAKLDEVEVTTTANYISDVTTTESSQTTDAVTTVSPIKVMATTPSSTAANTVTELFSEQNLLEFFPAGVAALGAALGRDGCYLKAACLAGRLLPPSLHSQGMMLLAAESLVPSQWKEVFRAAKSSMMNRQTQDCSSFACF